MRTWTACLALAAGLAVPAACGSGPTALDRAATERTVGRTVADVVDPPVATTTCAGSLPLEQGHRFTCVVELGGGAGTLDVEVRETDADGALAVEPQAAVLSDAEVGAALVASLEERFGRSFQAECGDDGPTVRPPGTTATCTARDRTSRRTVAVTVEDHAGTLSIAVQGEA